MEILPLAARPDLIETCAAWDYAEWGCHMPHASLAQTIESFQKMIVDDRLPLVWVACEGNKLIGMVSLVAEDHPDRRDLSPWLSALYVHPKYRQQGIASALCQHLLAEASDRRQRKIYLYTATANSLYKRLGWTGIGTVVGPTGLNEELMVWSAG